MAPQATHNSKAFRFRQELLLGSGNPPVFAILDGAAVPHLLDQLYGQRPEFECLYRGDLKPDMAEVAPYLVKLDPDSKFAEWLVACSADKSWGIFLVCGADLRILRQHFRKFLTVYQEETGKPLLFRYYDPRVLRSYLPTCGSEDLRAFFGPVERFLLEDEEPGGMLEFQLLAGELKTNRKKFSEVD